MDSGEIMAEIQADNDVHGLAFSRDGRAIAVGTRSGITTLWDVTTRTPVKIISLECPAMVFDANFSQDGAFLGTSHMDGTATVGTLTNHWKPDSGKNRPNLICTRTS